MSSGNKRNVELKKAAGLFAFCAHRIIGSIGDKYEKHRSLGVGEVADIPAKYVLSYRVENNEIIMETKNTTWHITSISSDCNTSTLSKNEVITTLELARSSDSVAGTAGDAPSLPV